MASDLKTGAYFYLRIVDDVPVAVFRLDVNVESKEVHEAQWVNDAWVETDRLTMYISDGSNEVEQVLERDATLAFPDAFRNPAPAFKRLMPTVMSKHLNGKHDQSSHAKGGGRHTDLSDEDWDSLQKKSSQTSLTRKEEHTFLDYQAEGYKQTNSDVVMVRGNAERRGITYERALKETHAGSAPEMERAFNKRAVALESDTLLHRGMSSNGAPLPEWKEGDVIQPQGFMSTTSSRTVAQKFIDGRGGGFGLLTPVGEVATHRRQMVIKTPAGTKVAPARSGERELLLHHSTKLKVTSVSMGSDGVEVVELEVTE